MTNIKLDRNSAALDSVKFVSAAVAKSDARYYLEYVRIEPDKMIATDGHRMHIANITAPIDPSEFNGSDALAYAVEKNLKTQVLLSPVDETTAGKFPDYNRVLPVEADCYRIDLSSGSDITAASISFAAIIRAMDTDKHGGTYSLNFDYFRAVLPYVNHAWLNEKSSGTSSIMFSDKETITTSKHVAVIMPMRCN